MSFKRQFIFKTQQGYSDCCRGKKKNKDHFYSNIYGMPNNKAIMTEILSFEYLKAILLVYSYEFKKYKF